MMMTRLAIDRIGTKSNSDVNNAVSSSPLQRPHLTRITSTTTTSASIIAVGKLTGAGGIAAQVAQRKRRRAR